VTARAVVGGFQADDRRFAIGLLLVLGEAGCAGETRQATKNE
jgi:hypothetical protein